MNGTLALEILAAFKNETYGNGKFKLKEADRNLLTVFIGFRPEEDTLDGKLYTRLNKLLAQGIKRGTQLTGLDILTRVRIDALDNSDGIYLIDYDDLKYFGSSAFSSLQPGKLTQYLFDKASPAELEQIEALRKRLQDIQPIVEKFQAMKDRVTRKGKLPKAIEKKLELHKIQVGLSPALKEALLQIKVRWEKVMVANFNSYYSKRVAESLDFIDTFSATPVMARTADAIDKMRSLEGRGLVIRLKSEGNFHGAQFRPASEKEILALAERDARQDADSFFDKLLFKLNGVYSARHPFVKATEHWYESTPFESSFTLEFEEGFSFILHSQIITNFSVYNKPFHQFPTVFRNVVFNGTTHAVMSHLQLKVLLAGTSADLTQA